MSEAFRSWIDIVDDAKSSRKCTCGTASVAELPKEQHQYYCDLNLPEEEKPKQDQYWLGF